MGCTSREREETEATLTTNELSIRVPGTQARIGCFPESEPYLPRSGEINMIRRSRFEFLLGART
jgi:hypothetical protein